MMNSQDSVRRCARTRSRRRVLDVDLNAAPPCEIREQVGPSNHTRSHDRLADQESTVMPQAIDVEALDDDVIISSPRAFLEAKNKNRRSRELNLVVDLESDERSARYKRRRVPTNQTFVNCDLYINLEGSSTSKRKSLQNVIVPPLPPPPPPPPPQEPTLSCPVCMGSLVEETSTKCGHIFCKGCIKAAISVKAKCPTCRRKTTVKDIFRIYLPVNKSA